MRMISALEFICERPLNACFARSTYTLLHCRASRANRRGDLHLALGALMLDDSFDPYPCCGNLGGTRHWGGCAHQNLQYPDHF